MNTQPLAPLSLMVIGEECTYGDLRTLLLVVRGSGIFPSDRMGFRHTRLTFLLSLRLIHHPLMFEDAPPTEAA